MKPKGIVREQIEKAVEEVRGAVSPLKAAEGVVAAVTGGKVSGQSLSGLEYKDRQEKAKGIAYFKRVIKDEQEAGQQSTSNAVSKESEMAPVAARQTESSKKKAAQMSIVKPPGDLKRRLPWQKPVTGKPEIKGFQTG